MVGRSEYGAVRSASIIDVCLQFRSFLNSDRTAIVVSCKALLYVLFWEFCACRVCVSASVNDVYSIVQSGFNTGPSGWVQSVEQILKDWVQSVGQILQDLVQSVGQILQAVSTVCWANTARFEYSLLGKYCKIWVQSVGQILQAVSTVCWTNTARFEYSLLDKYCKIWVQSVGQILKLCHYFTLRGIPTIIWILDFKSQLVYRLKYYLG